MIYKIPIWWSMCNDVEVEADSLQEAITKVNNHDLNNLSQLEKAMQEGEYIDDSLTVNMEVAEELNKN